MSKTSVSIMTAMDRISLAVLGDEFKKYTCPDLFQN